MSMSIALKWKLECRRKFQIFLAARARQKSIQLECLTTRFLFFCFRRTLCTNPLLTMPTNYDFDQLLISLFFWKKDKEREAHKIGIDRIRGKGSPCSLQVINTWLWKNNSFFFMPPRWWCLIQLLGIIKGYQGQTAAGMLHVVGALQVLHHVRFASNATASASTKWCYLQTRPTLPDWFNDLTEFNRTMLCNHYRWWTCWSIVQSQVHQSPALLRSRPFDAKVSSVRTAYPGEHMEHLEWIWQQRMPMIGRAKQKKMAENWCCPFWRKPK